MSKNYHISLDVVENYDGGAIVPKKDRTALFSDGLESNIPFVFLTDQVIFPHLVSNILLDNPLAIATCRKAFKDKEPVFVFGDPGVMEDNDPTIHDEAVIDMYGVVGYVMGMHELPDNSGNVIADLVSGPRARALGVTRRTPYLRGDITYEEAPVMQNKKSSIDLWEHTKQTYMEIVEHLEETDKKKLLDVLNSITPDTVRHFYFLAQNSPLDSDERYKVLFYYMLEESIQAFSDLLEEKKNELSMRYDLHMKTTAEIGQHQREDYLRTQMQVIKKELGDADDPDYEELKARGEKKEWDEKTAARFQKELRKLTKLNPASADYSVQYTYLDTLLDLPWNHCDNSSFELGEVERILDRDHFGLEKVKERIVEQMAVLLLRKDTKAPILCLYGPPGVGKTSLGKSVADALGRKYARVALGGLHDEAEIRGHRRTYLGSMPGRIITALQKCGTSDPVMVLDEIDKIGADYKGDPQQALLEVLDPEQNCKFHDNFVDVDYDLSKVLFIATANSLSTIAPPLLDRMELIEISGYIEEEKLQIAKRHLVAKALAEHGFADNEVEFTDDALRRIIQDYTRESGVRQLDKKIKKVLRKLARIKASGKEMPKVVNEEMLSTYLGPKEVFADTYENNDIPGIVTGLAWTQSGGDILFIESSVSPGKENKLVLTGNLGDVMKESAMLALQYLKANQDDLEGLKPGIMDSGTVHIHVPEGAVPKDGPSAGITILTSLASTFTGRKVRSHLAMTGELTLRGRVLPVGGIKEKILAAKRAGIKTVMMCEKNRKDVEEIKPEYLSGLDFVYIETAKQVLDYALLAAEDA